MGGEGEGREGETKRGWCWLGAGGAGVLVGTTSGCVGRRPVGEVVGGAGGVKQRVDEVARGVAGGVGRGDVGGDLGRAGDMAIGSRARGEAGDVPHP